MGYGPPRGPEGRATPSAHAVQVLGGTSRRKVAAVSITQQFRGVSVALSRRLGSRVVRPARFFCGVSPPGRGCLALVPLCAGPTAQTSIAMSGAVAAGHGP